jgi:hypothetical protein
MTKRKKPTNKEIVQEVQFLGNKVYEMYNQVRNIASVIDLYIAYNKDADKFEKFVNKRLKEANKDVKEKTKKSS